MAVQAPGQMLTKITAASFAAAQFRACALNSSGLAAVPAAGAKIYGIVQNDPASGEAATIMVSGESKMEASEAIDEGNDVAVTNDGRGAVAAVGEEIVGTAVTPAGAAGVYFTLRIHGRGVVPV